MSEANDKEALDALKWEELDLEGPWRIAVKVAVVHGKAELVGLRLEPRALDGRSNIRSTTLRQFRPVELTLKAWDAMDRAPNALAPVSGARTDDEWLRRLAALYELAEDHYYSEEPARRDPQEHPMRLVCRVCDLSPKNAEDALRLAEKRSYLVRRTRRSVPDRSPSANVDCTAGSA
jgi:hypothetical protein